MEKSKEPPTKPVWRRLRVPKMQHQLKSSLPRVLSRYARSDNARRRAVKGEIQAFGIMPARSEPNEEEEEEEPGALGQLRHLFDFPDRRRPAVGSPKAEAKPTFAQLRKKHGRLRFPRLAEKAGYDEELNRRNAALAAGRRRESTPNESDEEDELEERSLDTRSFWTMGSTTGSTFYSSYSSQRALRHRRLGPSPRPAILRRQHPVPAVSVGTTSTFHVNPLDAQNDLMGLGLPSMGASTASLLSSNLASTQPAPSTVSSWAPSVAASQGSVDRKWLARVAPISYLPSEAGTCAMRKDLLMEELQRLAGRKSMRMQRTVQALDSLTSAGSAGGYLSFENWGLTDDYLEALLEAHDGLGVREKKITDVPNGLVGVKHIHLGGNLLTERGLQVLVSVEGPADTLQTLNLTSNRLGLQGGSLCDSVASLYSLVELDLGSNQLGDAVTAELCRALAQGCPLLEGLGLARCRIGESWRAAAAGKALKELLVKCPNLKVLDLAWNALHGDAAEALLEGLYENGKADGDSGLRRLGLAWNRLGSKASGSVSRSARLLSNIFEDCKTLFHLDLSYNGFDTEDCAAMAVGLRSNHSLFGLHLVGNEAMVDEMGFIVPFQGGKVPKETCGDTASSAVHRYLGLAEMVHSVPQKLQLSHPTEISSIAAQVRRPATGMRLNPSLLSEEDRSRGRAAIIPGMSGKMPSASKDRLEVEDSWASLKCRVQAIGNALDEEAEAQQFNAKCCWICENWCEYRLMFSKKGGKVEANFVYALTSLDGFTRPIQLKKLGNHWAASKMLPPSLAAVEVIFIVDGQAMLSDSHSVRHIVPKSVVLDPEIFGLREAQPDEERQGSAPILVEVSTVNLANAGITHLQRHRFGEPTALCILESASDRTQVEVTPRQVPSKVVKAEVKKKELWTFETSTFRHFLRDHLCKPEECFDRDWNLCKAAQLIKNDTNRRELASLLRHGYLPWILAFWFAAMVDFQSHRYALGLSCNSWRELLIHTEGLELSTVRLLDDNMCKSSDLDCIYVAANTVEKEKRKTISVLPDKALARFQFLEAVVRLAFKRFLRAGPNHSSTEEMKKAIDALQDMLRLGEDVLEKRNSLHECLFTEECCFVYRDFQEQLRIIYEGYTSVSSYPGRRGRIISFGGWLTFCGQAMPEEPSTRLFREAFALGREVRADETSHYRHMELSWPEFLVSLGALVRLSPDFDTEFFAEQLGSFFVALSPLSDSLLAGNPATAGRKVGNHKDQALLTLIGQIFEEADDDETGTIDEKEFRHFFVQTKVQEKLIEFGISVSNLNMLFKSLDVDGEGVLTFDELCDGFLKMAAIMRSNERAISYIRKVFAEADADGSGTLDKDEFNNIFVEPSVKKKMDGFGIHATDLEDLFSLIDQDGSGQVSEDEVIAGFIMLRDPKTAGERGVALLSKIFEEADTDGSGGLDKNEYLKAFSQDLVTQQLTARNLKVPDWAGLFEVMDADGSGTLQWDELREGLVSFWARNQMESLQK